MTKQSDLFQLKITLHGSKPAIWREIIVPEDYTFFELHIAIQGAFGWEDGHLHQCLTDNPFKRGSNYKSIAPPDMLEMDDDIINEDEAFLNEYFKNPKDAMFYEYDFGDSWMHEIKLKKILPNDSKIKIPKIINGAMACPPEDCGGLWGYYDLIEAIKDPKNKAHKDMMDWLCLEDPKEFDPDKFDINEVKFKNS